MQSWVLCHRVRLHNALKEVAMFADGIGPPAVLHTSSKVVGVDPDTATVILEDGRRFSGDIVIGADGISVRILLPIAGLHIFFFKANFHAVGGEGSRGRGEHQAVQLGQSSL